MCDRFSTIKAVRVLSDQSVEPAHILVGLGLETHGRAARFLRGGATVEKIALRLLEARGVPRLEYESILTELLEIAASCRRLDDDAPPPGFFPDPSLLEWLRRLIGRRGTDREADPPRAS